MFIPGSCPIIPELFFMLWEAPIPEIIPAYFAHPLLCTHKVGTFMIMLKLNFPQSKQVPSSYYICIKQWIVQIFRVYQQCNIWPLACTLPDSLLYRIAGKLGGDKVWWIYSFWTFGEKKFGEWINSAEKL